MTVPAAAPAGDGKPFELALVMAMIAAANADGDIVLGDGHFLVIPNPLDNE